MVSPIVWSEPRVTCERGWCVQNSISDTHKLGGTSHCILINREPRWSAMVAQGYTVLSCCSGYSFVVIEHLLSISGTRTDVASIVISCRTNFHAVDAGNPCKGWCGAAPHQRADAGTCRNMVASSFPSALIGALFRWNPERIWFDFEYPGSGLVNISERYSNRQRSAEILLHPQSFYATIHESSLHHGILLAWLLFLL